VRERAGRTEDPTAVVLDSQTVRASLNAPAATTGLDAGKKSPGRKRGIATDVIGLLIAVLVTAANVHDNAIGTALLDKVAAHNPSVTKAWVDAGFKNAVVAHGAALGIDVEVVARDPDARGFAPVPKRWVVEQTWGTLMLHRRLVRDYETLPASAESMIYWSMSDNMTRRLTDTRTPTWRDPPRTGGST
jgi:transposase